MSAQLVGAFAAISATLGQLAENKVAWTYTINGFDGSPYLTRTLLPRVDGIRPLLHRIWRPDADPDMHNHPWATARFLILSGGYTEERLVDGARVERILRVGDENALDANTFHRIVHVEPDTWTFGLVGERVQEWGFLVQGAVIPWREYLEAKKPKTGGLS